MKTEKETIVQRIKDIEEDYEDESEEEPDKEETEMDLYQMEVVDDKIFWLCNLCDVGCDSNEEINSHMIKEHQKDINQINITDNDNRDDDIKERKSVNDQTGKDETLKCKLCRECMDGNSEVKTHYIKEHYEDMKRKTDN